MRITVSFILLFLLVFCLPLETEAATWNSKAGAVTTTGGNLNVRREASSGSAVVTSLRKGSYITLISKSGSWWKVEYAKGQYGYCHADYITIVQGTPVTVNTQTSGLNVRSGAGTAYGKVGTLTKGETILFLKESNGWSRVLYHGIKTGYVSAQFLSNYYSKVSLNVPNFKQTDSRWADTVIGSSGKTIAQIGCATTAVAMMESFRTGTTIYPNVMSQTLFYTPSGDIYWPSHFKTVSNSNDLLSGIYTKLKQGRPVLLGATNSYGSQHWVVIIGYTGGTNLNAGSFVIHDPGTYSRTNLQQFFNVYPAFYKYFYY